MNTDSPYTQVPQEENCGCLSLLATTICYQSGINRPKQNLAMSTKPTDAKMDTYDLFLDLSSDNCNVLFYDNVLSITTALGFRQDILMFSL